MQIKNMVKAKNPSFRTKAFFSIETKNFLIHNCRLVLADSGRLVVQMPYREYQSNGQKKYDPIIQIKDFDYLEAVGQDAVSAYEALL